MGKDTTSLRIRASRSKSSVVSLNMTDTRKYWLDTMLKIVYPVLDSLSRDCLRREMPIYGGQPKEAYQNCTYLEAFGRTMVGLAPWLGCKSLTGEEEELRSKYADLARRCITVCVDDNSSDRMNFTPTSSQLQPIVDAAFLAQAILRAPHELWIPLPEATKENLIRAMRATRVRKPGFNNWLLFSAMIECFLRYAGAPDWDPMRIDFALKQHQQWYKGDGVYGDGPAFHWDYYNSYVIQPIIYDIAESISEEYKEWANLLPTLKQRLTQYARIQEHFIAPDGSYPLIGRSLTYRFGAFQSLSLAAYQHILAEDMEPAQVRCGLSAVIRRIMAFESMFDEKGWLRIGICGEQPDMGELYISTGSLYLCSAVFLPLGLPPEDPFWSQPDMPWTMKALWNGENRQCEHAIP